MTTKKSRSRAPHVLIVGGGLMGASCALGLRRAGAEVTVLEKAVPGAEASSAAAGILGAEVENEAPGPMLDLCRRSRSLYPAWVKGLIKDTAIDPGYLEGGTLLVALDERRRKKNEERHLFQLRSGRAKKLSDKELHGLEPNVTASRGGLYFQDDARITPKLLFRATQLAAHKAGAIFRSGAYVKELISVTGEGGRPRISGVRLEDGTVLTADKVVVAAGSWTNLIDGLPKSQAKVIPARGQIVELECAVPVLTRLVFGAGVYLIPRADGRILIGSTLEFVGFKKGVTAEGVRDLLDGALRLVPALRDAEVTASWSNFRPYTEDELPLLGETGVDGLVVASGHYRNGILLAPVTAEVVTALCLGKKPQLPLEPFSPLRTMPKKGAPQSH